MRSKCVYCGSRKYKTQLIGTTKSGNDSFCLFAVAARSDSIKNIQVEEFIVNDLVNKLGKEVLTSYNIKKLVLSNLKIVDRSLFENNTSLKELELRDGLQEIKNSAFRNVKLEKLTLPKSLRIIDAKAFENCGLSKGINFGDSKNLQI